MRSISRALGLRRCGVQLSNRKRFMSSVAQTQKLPVPYGSPWAAEVANWVVHEHENESTHEYLHWKVTGANPRLSQTVSDRFPAHHLPSFAAQLAEHGASAVRKLLQIKVAATERGRSGNFAEIIATETLRVVVADFEFTINRLCWADCPLPMRGDDILGFDFTDSAWRVLKAESKGGNSVSASTVKKAREKLNEHGGNASPHSLTCCSERLREMGRTSHAALIEKAQIATGLPPERVEHTIFITSGSLSAETELKNDTKQIGASIRRRGYLMHIADYTAAMKAAYTLPPSI
jgi:hypothetical protein